MKLLIVNPEILTTPYDNKKTEIKKYMENLDFVATKSKDTNFLKRVALLLLNDEELSAVTIDYKNSSIEYINNLEYLITAKIQKKEEILIKVLSNEEEFIKVYNAKESDLKVVDNNVGFINWEEKNNITKQDWNNIDFLKERISLSSFEDVYQELIKKKNKIYLNKEFIDEIVRNNNQEAQDYYFSKLSGEELKYSTVIKSLEEYESGFFSAFLCQAMEEENLKDKELINIIKNELINEDNIDKIFNKDNIYKLQQYIPAKFRSHEHIVSSILENLSASGFSIKRLNLDEAFKIVGKKYLSDKNNFMLFVTSIPDSSMRTNDVTDKMLKEITQEFNLNEEKDKRIFDFLCNQDNSKNEYRLLGSIIKMIINKNQELLSEKEKINLFSKGLLNLEVKEIVPLINEEESFEQLLKNRNQKTNEVIKEKLKEIKNIETFIQKRSNIISFLRISYSSDWLKHKTVPQSWKENDDIIIETYGSSNYKDLPLNKRKELEESKDNVLRLIGLNSENYKLIRSEHKYDTNILKQFAYDNASEFEEMLNEIPKKKWFNFNFALKMIDYHPQSLYHIPEALFDNKQFTLSIFNKYENNNGYSIKDLLSEIPEELKSFLQDNNITKDYENILTKHFLKDSLEINFKEKNQQTKKLKI